MKLRLLQGALMVALTLYVAPARAQEKCATDHIHQHMMDSDPHYRQYFENLLRHEIISLNNMYYANFAICNFYNAVIYIFLCQ